MPLFHRQESLQKTRGPAGESGPKAAVLCAQSDSVASSEEYCDSGNRHTVAFAQYQPPYSRPYDPTNPFDRTELAGVIGTYIRKCREYRATAWRARCEGAKSAQEYRTHVAQTERELRQHEAALTRLRSYGRY